MALERPHSHTRHPSVLIVDDDQDTLQLYSTFLRFSGLRVWTAANATAALSRARDHRPDVVVTDIGLPGADGWMLCRQLRGDPGTRACGLIALTGWVYDAELAARAREAGVDVVLTKPCLPDALLAQITALRGRATILRVLGQHAIARADVLRTQSTGLAGKSAALQKRAGRRPKR